RLPCICCCPPPPRSTLFPYTTLFRSLLLMRFSELRPELLRFVFVASLGPAKHESSQAPFHRGLLHDLHSTQVCVHPSVAFLNSSVLASVSYLDYSHRFPSLN